MNEIKLTAEQEKALKYDNHIALTANAGSGKTFVFAKRFVKIAIEKNPELDKIIAITFTEKAAGELYVRIAKEIDTLISEGYEPKLLNKIRKRLVSAKISTIHSFCLSILRDYSPQAGLDANMTPIREDERDKLINKAFDDAFEDELGSASLRALLRYFGSKRMLKQTIKKGLEKRRVTEKLYREHYSNGKEEIVEYLKSNADKFFSLIIVPQITSAVDLISEINFAVAAVKPNEKTAAANELLALIEVAETDFEKTTLLTELVKTITTKSGSLALKDYAKALENKNEAKALFEKRLAFLKDFNFETLYDNLDELAELSVNFFDFYNKTSAKFESAKFENGWLDFEDILLKTDELLNNEDVINDLKSKYEYVMVDEYQDTNELQYEIIMPVLDKLKRGNLFVVGDEKQSIYMFNNAELEVFNETKKDVTEHEGEILELPHSFRLKPNNALFVNKLFSEVFANPNPLYNEVEFSPLIVTNFTDDEPGRVEFIFSVDTKDEPAPYSEAELVATKIKELSAKREINLSETAVLSRQNKHLAEIEKALAKEKIPYTVLGGVGYYQELVIRDIQNYLTFLSSVNNDLALVSILRAPFYSVSDTDLFKISLEGGESFWEKLRGYAELNEKFIDVVNKLQKHLEYADAYEIPTLLNKVLTETNYWAALAFRENSEQEIANVQKLLSASLETLKGDAVSLYEFAERLNTAIKEVKNEGAAPTSEESETVKVMTYHKSKGLEFDTVFLYKTNETLKQTSVKSREITFDKDFGLLAKTPSPQGYFYNYLSNPLVWMYQYYIARKEKAEAKRLFYVGVTRARKNLFLSAKITKSGKISENSFLGMTIGALRFSYDDTSVLLEGDLPYGVSGESRKMTYEIKIERNKYSEAILSEEEKKAETEFVVNTQVIEDAESNEFISATKIALYKFCPFKYKLTYELGFGKLFNILKNAEFDDYNTREESDENPPANLLGSVLHKALELEITRETLDEKLREATESLAKLGEDKNVLYEKSREILLKFMSSEIFSWLKSKRNFKNEYEIYLKNEDYYLFGIIDKLILEEKKVIVVDYKSDKVKDGAFEKKFSQYENQLKFYLFILGKLYPETKEFEARLVFLNYPENSIAKKYSEEEILSFGSEITEIVKKIRAKEFPKNEKNCARCVYFQNGKCVA